MYSDIAHYLLICTLVFTVFLSFEHVYDRIYSYSSWYHTIYNYDLKINIYKLIIFQYAFHIIGFFYSYINSDFTLINTVTHSNVLESIFYKSCGFWGNQDGSFILWIFMGSFYGFLSLLLLQRHKWFYFYKTSFYHYAYLVPWMIFLLFTTNPWLKHDDFFKNGLQLNPLLQDPILSIHPPFLYAGYLGFSIIFALSFIQLKEKWNSKHGIYWIRYFNLITWATLTLGISLGSWWAYYELGWGGWWFWDPVENISLIPWLISTILIHAFLLQKKGHIYHHGIMIHIFFVYMFTWWSTYLIRSGSLTSVHAFAQNAFSGFTLFILTVIMISYIIYLLYHNYVHIHHFFTFIPFSKEHYIQIFIYIFSFIAFIIFLTLHIPAFTAFFFNKHLSLSPNFYNDLFTPLILPFIMVIIMGTISSWKKSFKWNQLPFNISIFTFSMAVTFYLLYYKQIQGWLQLGFIFIFILFIYLSYLIIRHIRQLNAMIIAHFTVMILIAIIICTPYHVLNLIYIVYPGDQINIGAFYELIFRNIQIYAMNHYHILFFDFLLKSFEGLEYMIFPEQRYYILNGTWIMKPHVFTNLFSDLYVSLGKGDLEVGWYLKIIFNPFMAILWSIPFFLSWASLKMYFNFLNVKIKLEDFYNI